MLITVSEHSTGDGHQAVDYLKGTHDHLGAERAEVVVLRGNPRMTAEVINTLTTKHRYTSGVAAWAPEDAPTRAEIDSVLDDIERTAFAGLGRDQYEWCCVLHRDADGGVHVHFLIARVELELGRAFNAFPPGWRKDFDALRDYWNHLKGWARPDDPARAKPIQLGRMTPVSASQLHAGLDVEPDPRQSITDWLVSRIETGLVRDRSDVLASLAELGEINREGNDYISVRLAPGAKPIRLKGAIYVDSFNSETFIAQRAAASRSRTDPAPARQPDRSAADAARRELEKAVLRRAAFNTKRFGTPPRRVRRPAPGDAGPHAVAPALAGCGDGPAVLADVDRRGHLDDVSTRPGRRGAKRTRPGKRQSRRAAADIPASSSTTPKKEKVVHDRDRNPDRQLQRQRDRAGDGTNAARSAAGRAGALARAPTINGLHRLPRFAVAQIQDGTPLLLPPDALDRLVDAGTERAAGLRLPSPAAGGLGMTEAFDFDTSPEGLQARARRAINDATGRAAERGADRLANQPEHEQVLQQARALLPAAATEAKEAAVMTELNFLNPPPEPRPFGQVLDDTDLIALPEAGKREASERTDRERVAAQALAEQEIQSELKTKSKKQLELLQRALKNELSVNQAEAIEQMLTRFLRMVLRLVSLGSIELTATASEQRGIVARQGLEFVAAEIQRRTDVEVRHAVASKAPRAPRTQPAPEKFQIVPAHDPRQPPRDRDEVAREQDADRERNRK